MSRKPAISLKRYKIRRINRKSHYALSIRTKINDHVMYLSALDMPCDWFFLVFVTFWQVIHCSLQKKISKKAVLWQGNRTYDAVVKFDMYRNLQRHRVVPPAIARLSCYFLPQAHNNLFCHILFQKSRCPRQ